MPNGRSLSSPTRQNLTGEKDMALQDKLDALRHRFETEVFSPEINAVMHQATAALIASGQAGRALQAGDMAPSFVLPDSEGAPVSSEELLAQGPLVLTFYRGVWCPYCNLDLQAMEEVAARIRALGAALVAVSPQTPPNSRKARRDNHLSFPILSDPGGEAAAAFGVRFRLPDPLIQLYKDLKNDLPLINGDDSWTLPMPARYVIGRDGVIAYAEVNPDYTRRPEPTELLPALERLLKQAA
jgi:peroxiredoxin